MDGPESPRYTCLLRCEDNGGCLHTKGHRHLLKDDVPLPIEERPNGEENVLSDREAADAIKAIRESHTSRPGQPWFVQVPIRLSQLLHTAPSHTLFLPFFRCSGVVQRPPRAVGNHHHRGAPVHRVARRRREPLAQPPLPAGPRDHGGGPHVAARGRATARGQGESHRFR